jgi:hypothetical protein
MGTAPLDDPMFRSAIFEQLGGAKLEGAVTTDICGKKESHAVRLDKEAVDTIKKARLHQKVATSVFFESNGGQSKTEATLPEIRLTVAEPGIDIGNIETVLETLSTTCYFLSSEKSRYRFSLSPNLNKLLADRRASVQPKKIEERLRAEVQKVFAAGGGVDRVYFPDKSGQIPDRPVLTLVVVAPEQSILDKATRDFIESATKESGTSGRTYKSGLVWVIPDSPDALRDEARKVLAWEDIADEEDDLRLDEAQKRQLAESVKRAQRDAKETVWRTYKHLMLLGKDNTWKTVDLGLVHSSAAASIVELVLNRLRGDGDIEDAVSPGFLDRNWPPAFKEWGTKAVRDAFFASPKFPRLLNSDSLKDTIARGVENGMLGYVGKKSDGTYSPFHWKSSLTLFDVELSDDMYIVQHETAEAYAAGKSVPKPEPPPPTKDPLPPKTPPIPPSAGVKRVNWHGDVPPQKWMNFYTKVLSKFAAQSGLKIGLNVEIAPEEGVSNQKVDEIKVALRELGLSDDVSLD